MLGPTDQRDQMDLRSHQKLKWMTPNFSPIRHKNYVYYIRRCHYSFGHNNLPPISLKWYPLKWFLTFTKSITIVCVRSISITKSLLFLLVFFCWLAVNICIHECAHWSSLTVKCTLVATHLVNKSYQLLWSCGIKESHRTILRLKFLILFW